MKQTMLLLIAFLFMASTSLAVAGGEMETIVEEKIVVALSTDDFEIEETDLSHLAVGDAETIVTESGKTIDLLRTEDGIEIYVDGEPIEVGGWHDEKHIVHKIKIVCDEDEEDCDDLAAMATIEDIDIDTLHDNGHKFIFIGDEEGDLDVDVEMLEDGAHQVHGAVHIVKKFDGEDLGELHEGGEHEVIIIKKKVEDEI